MSVVIASAGVLVGAALMRATFPMGVVTALIPVALGFSFSGRPGSPENEQGNDKKAEYSTH